MSAYQTQQAKPKAKPDRIDRALALIENGMIKSLGDGRFHVESESQPAGYICTADSCTCLDYIHRGSEPCKHIWAGPGFVMVQYIGRARKAESLQTLQVIFNEAAQDRTRIPLALAIAARREFLAARTRLMEIPPEPCPGYQDWLDSLELERANREEVGQ